VDSSCSDASAVKTVTVLKTPTVPSNLQLPANNTSGSFTLTWTAASETVTRYEIWRMSHEAGSSDELIDTSTSTSYTYPVNHPDGTFDYRVKACNSGSCSGFSGKKAI